MPHNKHTGVDLGLELAMRHGRRGYSMPHRTIADFCECSKSYIYLVEMTALKKLRAAYHTRKLTD